MIRIYIYWSQSQCKLAHYITVEYTRAIISEGKKAVTANTMNSMTKHRLYGFVKKVKLIVIHV